MAAASAGGKHPSLSNPLLATSTPTRLTTSTSSLLTRTRHTGLTSHGATRAPPPTASAGITNTGLSSRALQPGKLAGTGLTSQTSLLRSSFSQSKSSSLSGSSSLLSHSLLGARPAKKEAERTEVQPSSLLGTGTRQDLRLSSSSSLLRSSQSLRSTSLTLSSHASPKTTSSSSSSSPAFLQSKRTVTASARAAPSLSLSSSRARLTSPSTSTRLTGGVSSATSSKLATHTAVSSRPSSLLARSVSTETGKPKVSGSRSLLSSTIALSPSTALPAAEEHSKPAVTLRGSTSTPAIPAPVIAKAIAREEVDAPEYDFSAERPKTPQEPKFLPPELDTSLSALSSPVPDVAQMKITLVNAVATSLLCSPDFRSSADPTRRSLKKIGEKLSQRDPEFILKVALYTRCDLNIRTTANFLLALAANLQNCRPYLKKYFCSSIRLPSDWIEIAEIYQAFHDKSINFGALPTALRKVMGVKFAEFDAYQLAKYNKDTSKKKKKMKQKQSKPQSGKDKGLSELTKLGRADSKSSSSSSSSGDGSSDESVVGDSEAESEEQLERMSFTLKQLIRKIHISDPVEYVMCLIGKRYPEDPESFRRSKLPGTWDQDRAGKRMKLPTPETWETQVSLKGNRAGTWESLIDHNKLPFMAMLRNLRNLIIAGVSQKHHQWALRKLNDERAVTNSRQFPFRFFSAYEVLGELEKIAKGEAPVKRGRNPSKGPPKKNKQVRVKEKEPPKIDLQLLHKYRAALDNALKIATCYNVKPISGSTLILCNVGSNMNRNCTAARGLGKPRTVLEVGILLGLMCKYACENCTMIIYGPRLFTEVSLREGTILHNMEHVMTTASNEGFTTQEGEIPSHFLQNMLVDRVMTDNLVVLTDTMKMDQPEGKLVMKFLDKYRHLVNPNLLFVSVDLSGSSSGVSSTIKPQHENDIYLAGYSDQILRFIAERGDSGQLTYVENIDKVYNLKEAKLPALSGGDAPLPLPNLTPERKLMAASQHQRWRTVRVFISSTFRDMHGERDLLTRFVFPELRARARTRQIQLYEVDLRWGVTEEDTRSHKALEICLNEISRCQYFIGLLGNRYGWVPDEYPAPDSPEYDWLKEYPPGRSITEVEMHHAALCEPERVTGKSFFYFRDPSFLAHVPPYLLKDFESESHESKEKIEDLKSRIRCSGLEVCDNYSCHWLGAVEGKLMVGGLEDFGQRVLHNLWNAIQRDYPEDEMGGDPVAQATALHEIFSESRSHTFVGRRTLLKQLQEAVESCEGGVVAVSGKPGSGKSSFMAAYSQYYKESGACRSPNLVLPHFIGAAPDSTNIASILTRLCHEMKRRFGVSFSVPEDYTELVKDFPSFLEESVTNAGTGSKVLVLIDGLDLLEDKHNGRSMEWLPEALPKGVVVVLSGVDGGHCMGLLRRRQSAPAEVKIGAMDIFDKAEMVRRTLSKHRKSLNESPFNNQMKLLLTKKEAVNPLYLHLACEELRVFGVFEEVTAYLKSLPPTVSNLLQDILLRLETEHSSKILSTSLILLCLVRNGLLECELSAILTSFFTTGDEESQPHLPPMVLSRLLRSLQTFLQPTGQESSDRLSLAHKDTEKAVRLRYMRGAASEREKSFHELLAGYFRSEADPTGDKLFKGNNARAFSELPFHLMVAGAWKELEETLCNIHFVITKCQLGLAGQLLEDYSPSTTGLPSGKAREVTRFIQQPKVQVFKSFISRNLHVLASNPVLALQQAVNEPASSAVAKAGQEIIQKNPRPLVTWVNKPEKEDPCQLNLSTHVGPATAVAVSQDSTLFAVGFKNCSVKLYEISTGREVHSFLGHAAGITSVCFVGTQTLCSASHDKTLSLWDIREGFRIATLKGHTRSVRGCSANQSGKAVASVSWDTTIKVWDGREGKLLSTLKTPGFNNTPINCVSFHPEGQLIAVGAWDSTVKIWDTFNRKKLKALKGHKTAVQACAYAPSGRHIVSAALDGEVKIWSTKSGSAVGSIAGHISPVNSIAFTPSGQFLVTASSDKVVKVWSGTLGQPVKSVGEEKLGFAHCIAFDSSSQTIRVGYHDGSVRKFNIQTGAEGFAVKPHEGPVVGVAYREKLHMSASADGSVKIWSPTSLPKCIQLTGHKAPVTCAVWEKTGFASASEDFVILVWPHTASTYIRLGKTSGQGKTAAVSPSVAPVMTFRGHKAKISSIAFSSDGIRMVSASHDHSLIVWDTLSQKHLQTLHACHKDWVTACAFSDTSTDWLISGSNDFTLKLWDLKTGTEKTTFRGHTSSINSVSFSQGCIASAAVDGSVKVWTRKGIEITTMFCHKRRVNQVILVIPAKSNNASSSSWADIAAEDDPEEPQQAVRLEDISIITASDDGTVGVWKPFVPNEITALVGHSDRVLSVVTTTDNHILSSSLDGTVRVWTPELVLASEAERLSLRGTAKGHTGPVSACTVAPGGGCAISTGRDGNFIVWAIRKDSEGSGVRLERVYDVKASEKALSAACLISVNSKSKAATAVIGRDDGAVIVYQFTPTEYPSVETTHSSLMGEHPVSKLTLTTNNKYVIASSWAGRITAIGSNQKVVSRMDDPKDWVMDVTAAEESNTAVVYAVALDHTLYRWPVLLKQSSRSARQPASTGNASSYPINLAASDKKKAWPLAVADLQSHVAISDSNGSLSLWNKETKRIELTKRVHQAAINTLTTMPGILVTGSDDATIKVWRVTSRPLGLKQVGLFHCQSSVTAIATASRPAKNDPQMLLVGDSLGHVNLLQWHQ